MKLITSVYLNCRPDLRDEWLTGSEVDDASDALVGPSTNASPLKYLTVVLRLKSMRFGIL